MEEKIIQIEAVKGNLLEVLGSVEEYYEEAGCPIKTQMQINIAVEEIFVNIASYAYAPETGIVRIRLQAVKDPARALITFEDSGVPYDPLAKEDPDVTLSAEERKIGGLGIYMVKQSMDHVRYEYKDGKNILTLEKEF